MCLGFGLGMRKDEDFVVDLSWDLDFVLGGVSHYVDDSIT